MLKHKVDRRTLETLYKSYIRPILEYADSLWNNCTVQQLELLESVQLEALRIITGMRRGTSHNKLYNDTIIPALIDIYVSF